MTNWSKRILLPLLIDKWRIATKNTFNTFTYKRILLPLLIDKWQIATKEYFFHY